MTNEQIQSAAIPQSKQTLLANLPFIGIVLICWITLYFVTGWISKLLVPQVRTLKSKEQMFWQLACVRSVCGLFTLWACRMIFLDTRLARDFVFASTDESWNFVCILLAFFTFEELALAYFDRRFHTFSLELHLHHFLAFVGYFSTVYYNRGHYFAIKAFILEASTPFSCICWCLLKLKLEHTKAWKINQWILIYIFHLRSVYEVYWWYEIWTDWTNIRQNLPLVHLINMVIGLAIVSLWLTPYWTYKKTAQYFNPIDWNAENAKGKKQDAINKTS